MQEIRMCLNFVLNVKMVCMECLARPAINDNLSWKFSSRVNRTAHSLDVFESCCKTTLDGNFAIFLTRNL